MLIRLTAQKHFLAAQEMNYDKTDHYSRQQNADKWCCFFPCLSLGLGFHPVSHPVQRKHGQETVVIVNESRSRVIQHFPNLSPACLYRCL